MSRESVLENMGTSFSSLEILQDIRSPEGRGGGRGWGAVLRLMFAGYVPLTSQSSYPIIVYSFQL